MMLALLAVPTRVAWAQLELSDVSGRVSAPEDRFLPGALVVLLDHGGAELRRASCEASGRFLFRAVAPGSYYVRASSGPLVSALRAITVANALPIDIELRVAPRTEESLVVTPGLEPPALATRTSVAGDSVRQAPGRLAGRGLTAAVADTAGWATEDNGLVHARGVDDGFLYVIDGVPLYERFDVLFGIAPEPALVSSMNVITGHLPAEFGLKAGGVIEINTGAAPSRGWAGALEAAAGADDTRGGSGRLIGPVQRDTVLALHLSGERSDRFLDPVHPANLHNDGLAYQGDARLVLEPSLRHSVRLGLRLGRAEFDVPHGEAQEEAGQDQRQRLGHALALASWQGGWSASTVSQLAVLGSFTEAALRPSSSDLPLSATASRAGSRVAALGSLTHSLPQHVLKAGFEVAHSDLDESFSFHVTDPSAAVEAEISEPALEFDATNPFVFAAHDGGFQLSGYVQDTWRAFAGFVLNAGLRLDRTPLPRAEFHISPRLAAAYRPSPSSTLRVSVNRYFQPPQPEFLLLASSEEARALSPFAAEGREGGAVPRGETQTGLELGWERWLGRVARLDMALWHRRATDVSDPNVLLGTTIFVPNSVARGRATGFDVRVDLSRRRGVGGYLSYTLSKVDQYGPITGGLFLEESFLDIGPGTRFTPDHDQRHVGVVGLSYDRGSSFWLQARGRYESGTPIEVSPEDSEELRDRPGVDRVDLALGRVKPRVVLACASGVRLMRLGPVVVEARLEALNLTNAAYAFNFGNPFSGTHFGASRSFAVKLRIATRPEGGHDMDPVAARRGNSR